MAHVHGNPGPGGWGTILMYKDNKNIIGTYRRHYNVKLTYTKDKEIFRQYLATYKNSHPKMPFFFEIEKCVVKRIIEKYFI